MTKRDLTAETAEDKFNVEAEAKRRGLQPYQVRATQAVGDQLIKDIVADARRGISQSASPIPPAREKSVRPRGSGWQDAQPVSQPPGVNLIDKMCDAQDRAAKAAAIRQRVENEWIEGLLERRNPHKATTEYDPFSRSRMGFHDDE
jgi:hypothetical protein